MNTELENLGANEDIVDVALREAVRQGKIVRSKDDQGRDVYKAVPVS